MDDKGKPDVDVRELPDVWGESYFAGRDGSIWTNVKRGRQHHGEGMNPGGDRWRQLKPNEHRSGHLRVNIRGKTWFVHQLVLLAWVGPCPPGMEVCHFPDRDPKNNRLDNLRYGTPKENTNDAKIHGTRLIGERHNKAKLTDEQVMDIRNRPSAETCAALATEFGLTITSIVRIRSGRGWTHLPGGTGEYRAAPGGRRPGELNGSAKLTEEKVREMRAKAAEGASYQKLANEYGVTKRQAGNIVLRTSWGHIQ